MKIKGKRSLRILGVAIIILLILSPIVNSLNLKINKNTKEIEHYENTDNCGCEK